MKKTSLISKMPIQTCINKVDEDLSGDSFKEKNNRISVDNQHPFTNHQKEILIISGNISGTKRTKSFHFEIISAAQQMKERNSAYQFFSLSKD